MTLVFSLHRYPLFLSLSIFNIVCLVDIPLVIVLNCPFYKVLRKSNIFATIFSPCQSSFGTHYYKVKHAARYFHCCPPARLLVAKSGSSFRLHASWRGVYTALSLLYNDLPRGTAARHSSSPDCECAFFFISPPSPWPSTFNYRIYNAVDSILFFFYTLHALSFWIIFKSEFLFLLLHICIVLLRKLFLTSTSSVLSFPSKQWNTYLINN